MGYTLNGLSCTRRKWLVCWGLYLLALSLIVYKETWVKFNTWCKAFIQHGYVLRDNYNEILSCPLKHCDFFKVMKLTLTLEINYFTNQFFFTEAPIVWNRFYCFLSWELQLHPEPYKVNWTMDYPWYFPGMKGRGEEGVLNKVLYMESLTLQANSFCIPSTDKWCPFHTPSLEL